jgi:hypothetical protein
MELPVLSFTVPEMLPPTPLEAMAGNDVIMNTQSQRVEPVKLSKYLLEEYRHILS